ncbi:hypothetical protein L7F22_041656 [Adiantum nelumboides]|nr:hypothetical protein [Adiantum nelumboides]
MNHNIWHALGMALIAVNISVQHWISLRDEMAITSHVGQLVVEELQVDMAVLALHAINCIATLARSTKRHKKAAIGVWYVKPRSSHFWHTFFDFTIDDDVRFEENLRIPRACFDHICVLVQEDLQQKVIPQQFLEAIPSRALLVRKKVAMSLHVLGVGGPLHNIANMYGVGQSTVSRVFRQFVCALLKYKSTIISWQTLKQGFERKQGFSNCCNAIDVTHINMELPNGEAHSHWFDKDQNYSMSLQGVVDSNMRFLEVIGILNGPGVPYGQHQQIREYIIGDGGYLNLPWLVIPYPVADTDPCVQTFNYKLSSNRIVIEHTFGHLKQMWGYLQQRVRNPDVDFLPSIIVSCSILHNIWVDYADPYVSDADMVQRHGVEETPRLPFTQSTRDIVFHYLKDCGHL